MNTIKLFSILMLGGSIVACGGGGGSDSGGGPPDIIEPPVEEVTSQIDITTEAMPLIERFSGQNLESWTGGEAIDYFFSENYKPLNTPASHELTDEEGNAYTLTDPRPAFYYPTCCFYEEDATTGEYTGELIPELEERWKVGDGKLMFGNARFTVGQILSDLTDSEAVDRKSDTADGAEGASVTAGSWGELKLDEAYRISYCVNDSGSVGTGTSNMEVFVDNNSGGNESESIHGAASTLLRTPILGLQAGHRMVINVPGQAYQVDADGNQVGDVLKVSEALDENNRPVGTLTSFLQFRVSSGGYVVISDLVVEYQDDEPVAYQACEVDEAFYVPPAPEFTGTPFTGVPFTVDLASMTSQIFFGGDGEVGGWLSVSDDVTDPFYDIISGSDRVIVTDGQIRFGNSHWTMGMTKDEVVRSAAHGGETHSTDTEVFGDLNLTVPYRISMNIVSLPDASATDEPANAKFQVQVDNNDTSSGSSMHGEASQLLSEATIGGNLTVGELIINVPGAITMEGVEIGSVPALAGTANSFLWFRCSSDCGNADVNEAFGITLSDLSVEYQGEGPVAPTWTGQALPLLGEPDEAPSGSVSESTETSVTLTAGGGKLNSSNFSFYLAYQHIEQSDFIFTAQISAITPPAAGDNSYRFGMMVLSDIAAGATFDDLPAYADLGFYVSESGELTGSRSQMKIVGKGRSRSDTGVLGSTAEVLEVGDWMRLEIKDADDGTSKVITWYVSKDGGVTWIEESSKSTVTGDGDFRATAENDSWYVGFFGAPGAAETVTMEFDNISIAPL